MTVINIRGTSGSGKSTLARNIRDLYTGSVETFHEPGRKRPIGTIHHHSDVDHAPLAMVGHYETPCGGTDTITNMDKIFELVRRSVRMGCDVLFEGLLISADFNRMKALADDIPNTFVVGLDIPLELALESVNERRYKSWGDRCMRLERQWQERASLAASKGRKEPKRPDFPGTPDPVPEKNTRSKWKAVKSVMVKLEDAGVNTMFTTREQAYHYICDQLGLDA